MRVTDAYLHAAMLRRVQQGYGKVAEASAALSSGRRVQTAADDPYAADALRRLDSERKALADGLVRSRMLTGGLEAAEAALGESTGSLVRVFEIAIQMGNDTYDASARAAAAEDVRQIKASLLAIANTDVDGKFVFSGRAEDTTPFDDSGAWQGDPGAREVDVARGLRVEATVSGGAAFSGTDGGVDIFATLDALAAALEANDGDAVATLSQDVDTGRDQLSAARADLGARLNLLDRAAAFGERLQVDLEARRRDLVDTDVAKAATELSQAENTLQAAVSVTQRLMEPSILRMLM